MSVGLNHLVLAEQASFCSILTLLIKLWVIFLHSLRLYAQPYVFSFHSIPTASSLKILQLPSSVSEIIQIKLKDFMNLHGILEPWGTCVILEKKNCKEVFAMFQFFQPSRDLDIHNFASLSEAVFTLYYPNPSIPLL